MLYIYLLLHRQVKWYVYPQMYTKLLGVTVHHSINVYNCMLISSSTSSCLASHLKKDVSQFPVVDSLVRMHKKQRQWIYCYSVHMSLFTRWHTWSYTTMTIIQSTETDIIFNKLNNQRQSWLLLKVMIRDNYRIVPQVWKDKCIKRWI